MWLSNIRRAERLCPREDHLHPWEGKVVVKAAPCTLLLEGVELNLTAIRGTRTSSRQEGNYVSLLFSFKPA